MTAERADEWLTIGELARRRGVDRAAISRKVGRLEAQGLLKLRPGPRSAKLIDLVEFERVAAATTDEVRTANGRKAAGGRPRKPSPNLGQVSEDFDRATSKVASPDEPEPYVLSREQARSAALRADLAQLERDERLGELVRVDDLIAGATEHGESLGRIIDRIPDRADELAALVIKDGPTGLRIALKGLARVLRGNLADALAALAQEPSEAHSEAEADI